MRAVGRCHERAVERLAVERARIFTGPRVPRSAAASYVPDASVLAKLDGSERIHGVNSRALSG